MKGWEARVMHQRQRWTHRGRQRARRQVGQLHHAASLRELRRAARRAAGERRLWQRLDGCLGVAAAARLQRRQLLQSEHSHALRKDPETDELCKRRLACPGCSEDLTWWRIAFELVSLDNCWALQKGAPCLQSQRRQRGSWGRFPRAHHRPPRRPRQRRSCQWAPCPAAPKGGSDKTDLQAWLSQNTLPEPGGEMAACA